MKIILSISIIFLIYQINKSSQRCSFDTAFRDDQKLILTDFNNFTQLSFNCPRPINISYLQIEPTKKITLDNSLNFNQTVVYSTQPFFVIVLNNFKGFDLKSDPFDRFKLVDYCKECLFWNLINTNLNFFFQKILIDEHCNITLLETHFWNSYLFNASMLSFHSSTIYSKRTCPLIFRNANIQILDIYISSSFINRNKPDFKNINDNENKLNSKVYQLFLSLYHADLDEKTLNKDIFKKLKF